MNRFLKLAIVGLVASCGGGGNYKAPRNLESACAIAAERPAYMRAMKATERRWGVPVHVQMATIHQESKFIGDARTPHQYALGVIPIGRQSSAFGYSQALDGTWDEYRRASGNRLASRTNFADAVDFVGWYHRRSHEQNGIALNDAYNLYLSYYAGHAGFRRGVWRSNPGMQAAARRAANMANSYAQQLRGCRL